MEDLVLSETYTDESETKSNIDNYELKSNNKKPIYKKVINYAPIKSSDKPSIIITKTGAFIKFSYLSSYHTDQGLFKLILGKIEKHFTIKHTSDYGPIKQIKRILIDRVNSRAIVPRFGVFELLNKSFQLDSYTTISQIKSGLDPEKKMVWSGELTHNQKIIIEHIMKNIYTKDRVILGSAGLILNLEAGQGKSYLSAYLVSLINKKTLLILHTTALIEQWVKVFNRCIPNASIGYFYAKKKIFGDIMIMIVDSARKDKFTFELKDCTFNKDEAVNAEITDETISWSAIDFYNMFGMTIYDECHEYANKSDSKVFKFAQTPYMIGLSATPDENANKFDCMYWWEIGPVLNADKLIGYQSTKEDFKADVYRIMYYGNSDYTKVLINEITQLVSVSSTINMICEDESRDELVLSCIGRCLEQKNLYIYVFADRRDYLEKLRIKTDAKFRNGTKKTDDPISEVMFDDDDFMRLVGGTSAEDIEKAEIKSRIIFTTYAFGGTGRSIIKMNALIFATPRKSKMKQYVKRIFRLGSDASISRQIYDIVDMKLTVKNQWSYRKAYYDSMGFTTKQEKHYFKDYIVDTKYIKKNKTAEKELKEIKNKQTSKKLEDKQTSKKLEDKQSKKDVKEITSKEESDEEQEMIPCEKNYAKLKLVNK